MAKRPATASVWRPDPAGVYFSDRFRVNPDILEEYGALDISVVTDLPLFIDPFLLFNSDRAEYQALHNQIVDYLRFLRAKAEGGLTPGLIKAWYSFGEVKQNWLGFTVDGNRGHGLGRDFAVALHAALGTILGNVGSEALTLSSHLEKLALIKPGVGRDTISDFTTNLIKHYLCAYTEEFAKRHLASSDVRKFRVRRATFNYNTETWVDREYLLPDLDGEYVLLTPIGVLTTDDTWINRVDMMRRFDSLVSAVGDEQLRSQLANYFKKQLSTDPTEAEIRTAQEATLRQFPDLIDMYIRTKEDTGDLAKATAQERTHAAETALIDQVRNAADDLRAKTEFYLQPCTSIDEARRLVGVFKQYVEDQDGYKVINQGSGKPGFASEDQVQLYFGLLLQASRFDVNREPNNGRGPVDHKLSAGAHDKALIEFKLARSTSLKRNLANQVDVYMRANKTKSAVTVILCYTEQDQERVARVLADLPVEKLESIVVIDARADNKPSASTL